MTAGDKSTLKFTGLAYLILIALQVFIIVTTPRVGHTANYACIFWLAGIWVGMWMVLFVFHRDRRYYHVWSRTGQLVERHAVVMPAKGQAYVWCPVGEIASYSKGDIDHGWCEWCKKFFGDVDR